MNFNLIALLSLIRPINSFMIGLAVVVGIAIGSPDMLKVDKIKNKEALRLNAGTAITAGLVANVKNDIITITLRRPITAEYGSRIAISRRLGDRWRLIGVGVIS